MREFLQVEKHQLKHAKQILVEICKAYLKSRLKPATKETKNQVAWPLLFTFFKWKKTSSTQLNEKE